MKDFVHSVKTKTARIAKKYGPHALSTVMIVGTAIITYQKEQEKIERTLAIGEIEDE